jgi:hypothetical protein
MKTQDDNDVELVQLATRIPRRLVRSLKEFCVRNEIPMQSFVRAALSEKLARTRTRGAARLSSRGAR